MKVTLETLGFKNSLAGRNREARAPGVSAPPALAFLLGLVLSLSGCKGCERIEHPGADDAHVAAAPEAVAKKPLVVKKEPSLPQYTGAQLTKVDAALMLRAVLAALNEGRSDAIEAYFAVPEGATTEDLIKQAPSLLENKEISNEGIGVLRNEGKYGALSEVVASERAAQLVSRFGADPAACMAFSLDPGEVAFCRFDGVWKIIRLDDVGKLTK